MDLTDAITATYERLGTARRTFRCCDTEFYVHAAGRGADAAADRARRRTRSLASQLNAFDAESAVARLNREGTVENEHVARLVRRGLAYHERTDGAFDIRQGSVEQRLKSYLRGESESLPETFDAGKVSVDGATVAADSPVDLNGLAKGYIVDRVATELAGFGRAGFVSGGGDMSPPPGPVAIESPYDDDRRLKVLDTDWNVATSGGYRRTRDGTDHVYNPHTERLGAHHESVTVVAERDCLEADALATTLAALPLAEVLDRIDDWPGAESLVVHDGVFHTSTGFEAHVHD